MVNRRDLLLGAGALILGSPIAYSTWSDMEKWHRLAQHAEAQVILPSNSRTTVSPQDTDRVYKSGETIDTILGPFKIDGWNIVYSSHAVEDFKTKNPGRKADYQFYPNMDEGASYVFSEDHSRDLGKGIEAQVFLPTDYHRQVLLEITNNGRPSMYRILLEPHISPDAPGIVSEIPINNSKLEDLSDIISSFWIQGQLFINEPYPAYILKRDEPRRAYLDVEQRHIEIRSSVVTNPRFENEAQMLLFDALAGQLAVRNSIDPNQRPHIQLFESYLKLVDALGFRPIWVYRDIVENQQQRKTNLLNEEAEKEAEKNPNFAIFHAPSYIPNGQALDTSFTPPYAGDLGLFAAAITTFRFVPKEFIGRYNNNPSVRKDLVNPAANAVLSALEARMLHPDDTSVVIGRKKIDEDILKLIPAYYELRSA